MGVDEVVSSGWIVIGSKKKPHGPNVLCRCGSWEVDGVAVGDGEPKVIDTIRPTKVHPSSGNHPTPDPDPNP